MSEMTATRLAKPATLVTFTVGWLVAAWLLWQTSVPGSLRLPHVELHGVFSASILRRSARYDGLLRWLWVVATLVQLAALGGLTLVGPRVARAFELGGVAKGVMVGAVTTLGLWAVGLPFGAV